MKFQLSYFLWFRLFTEKFSLSIRVFSADGNHLNNRVFLSRNYRLRWKFDVYKKNICPRSFEGKYASFIPDRVRKQNKQIVWENFPGKMRKDASIMRKTYWLIEAFPMYRTTVKRKALQSPIITYNPYLWASVYKGTACIWSKPELFISKRRSHLYHLEWHFSNLVTSYLKYPCNAMLARETE